MVSELRSSALRRFSLFSIFASAAVVVMGFLVLAGWQWNVAILKSGAPGLTAMNPGGTALAFILAGSSVLLMSNPASRRALWLGNACAAGVLVIALAFFAGQLLGVDSGPDQMLFRAQLDREAAVLGHVNRMAPNTATAFILAGLALILMPIKIRGFWPFQLFALGGMLIALMTIIGYSFSLLTLAGVRQFIPMALNTAICFALLNAAILCIRPERGMMSVISGAGPGSIMARRLLPLVVVIPIGAGWGFGFALRGGMINEMMALGLFAITNILVFAVLVWWTAASLERSERRRQAVEGEMEDARQSAEKANRAKSEFLANMSHELRTPMNSILGLTRLLYEDDDISEENREMVGIVYRSADNLLDILNDILDLSKIEAMELKLESVSFSLQEVVSGIISTMLPISSEKGISLACRYKTENIPYLIGDPLRVGRIVMNLVSNAVKYTEEGSVTVEISLEPLEDDRVEIRGTVSDTGIGIPADKLQIIFDKFAQADDSTTRRFGGTGLGLAITRQLVEMMGGTIDVRSEVGKGSEFSFAIPFRTSGERPVITRRINRPHGVDSGLPNDQKIPVQDCKLLLAEDHLTNQSFMRKLLKRMGIGNFEIVGNGREALDALEQGSYDILITDCHMPEMSGYELARALREKENPIPIIATTADAMRGTRERCLEAGMNDYITKPINPDELQIIFEQWLTFPSKPKTNKKKNPKQQPVVNLDLLRDYADTPEELSDFINDFLLQAEESIKTLKANCADGTNENWVRAAHKLKGGAAMFNARKLQNLCEQAQQMEAASQQERETAYDKIHNAFNEVRKSLKASI